MEQTDSFYFVQPGEVELPWGPETVDINEAPYEMYGESTTHRNYFIQAYWLSEKLLLDSWVIEARVDTQWGGYLGGWEDGFARFSYNQSNPWYYEFSDRESIEELKVLCEASSEHELSERLTLLAQYPGNDGWDTDQWIGNDQFHTKLLERGFLPAFPEDDLSCWGGDAFALLYDSERLMTILDYGAPLAQKRTSVELIRAHINDRMATWPNN